MSAFKIKIRNTLRSRKINSFLLFLIMAFGILVLTKLSRGYTNTIFLNIEAKQLPEEVVLLSDSTHQVKLTLTTYGFRWLKYYLKPPKVVIDFEQDVTRTNSAYIWTANKGFSNLNMQFDKEVKIESISPDTLLFKYDVNEVKKIPVKLNAAINYSIGYDALLNVKTNPDSILIIGPKSLLSKMETVETEFLELKDVNKPINENINLQLDSIADVIKINTRKVSVIANVEKFTEGTIEVPITLINTPNRFKVNYFPKSIKVSYYTSLSLFNSIKTSDFKIICDFKKINETTNYLTPELVSEPINIKTARMHQQNIEFIISE
ncbi:YbbR-like domain-containing protein [uncultured Lacinutrix sp.]|uniref:CdaR family protein n=1 Tax=uncultured Lacinutrix sp. TaxID=574032 RepID=UPI00263215FC|nr:YbbR-like domain-containing protein [uncultured Lacinutrix sp.]